ncbi:lytic transglycosylase domain-containing protein [Candidatus Margulisiibacteriota bacterium]
MEASFIIPIILFVVVFVLPGPDVPSQRRVATYNKKIVQKNVAKPKTQPRRKSAIEDDLDYKTIHKYIRSTFKKVPAEDARLIAKHLVEMGKEKQLDPKFVAAVMARESGFNKKAVSRTGAKGLGQIKDFNYKSLKIKDPFSIKQNANGTVSYLKRMLSKWKGKDNDKHLALASYFKGYGAVSKDGGKFDRATKGYVDGIMKYYEKIKKIRTEYED